jgi:Rieske Fe-S protein
VGPAAVDFMLSSGRMPLANPADQPQRTEPKFTPGEIAAIVAYLARIAPGGPPIPEVDPEGGSLSAGSEVFLNNCAACHGAGATGDSIGGGEIAPALDASSPVQIAEAVRVGPGLMPRYNARNLTQRDVDSVARYLLWLRQRGEVDRGGLQLGRVGAVAEGLVAYSKICTHAGCPLGLYLAAVHQLRCPCHQSTFDVLDGATPVYGPAARPLPQLPLAIAEDGSLYATGDFPEPVGPSFWSLG